MAWNLADFIRTNRQWGNMQQIASDELLGLGYQAFLGAQQDEARLALQGWMAGQQLQARGEDRNLLLGLLGTGAGGAGAGTGTAFGGPASQLFQQNLADIGQMGQGETNRINQSFTDVANSGAARLEARGLGGSNLVNAGRMQAEREKQSALLDVNDKLAGLRVGARSQEANRQTSLMQSLLGQLGNFNMNFDFG